MSDAAPSPPPQGPAPRTASPNPLTAPLAGVRVLDLTRLLPGPYATQLLGDFGADVVKLEDTGAGDPVRLMPPHLGSSSMSAGFFALNRNKRSIAVDMKREEGLAVVKRLAVKSDVVVEGFRPGVCDRLGLRYDELQEMHPGLIWCSITGFGQAGPYREHAGHDVNYLAIAGALGITVGRDERPVIPGVQIADLSGALSAVIGILLALRTRDRTGRGQLVDQSMTDAVVSLLSIHAAARFAGEELVPGRMTLSGGLPSYGVYRAKDGRHLALGALEPKFWQAFCGAAGKEDWVGRQFAQGEQRDALEADLDALFATRTAAEWLELTAEVDCCLAPVHSLDEVWEDPQIRERHLRATVPTGLPDPKEADIVGPGIRLGETPGKFTRPAPALGQHTEEVLNDFGFGPMEVVGLKRAGVVRTGASDE